jgi:hypothetical protein
MELSGKVDRSGPCVFRGSGEKPGELAVGGDNGTETELGQVDHGGGTVDDPSDRGLGIADDSRRGDHGAEPMKEIEDVGTGDAREEVLVATGESDDLVREDRADDDDLVVAEEQSIDIDGNIEGEQTAGELLNFIAVKGPNAAQFGGLIPGVVVEPNRAERGITFGLGDLETPAYGGFAHGLMGAKGDHEIALFGHARQDIVKGSEDQADGGRSGSVGDDGEDALVAVSVGGAGLTDQIPNLIGCKAGLRCAQGCKGCHD